MGVVWLSGLVMRVPEVDAIRAAFSRRGPEPSRADAPPGVSAVLLALYEGDEGPALLYTERTESLRSHPGEVSFPGGRVDPADPDPLAAALREAEEEVGLRPDEVDVLGHLTDFLTHRNVLICAYVGLVVDREAAEELDEAPRLSRSPPTEPRSVDEVARVFTVPLRRLLEGEPYEARRVAGMPEGARVHYWNLPPKTIWGITGELTARFLARVYGWTPPKPPREITDLSEFRPAPRRVA